MRNSLNVESMQEDNDDLFFSGDTRLHDRLARKPYARRGTVRQRTRHDHREGKVFFPRNATETEAVPVSMGKHQRWRLVRELLDENLHGVRCDADPRRGTAKHRRSIESQGSEANQKGARRNVFLVQGRKGATLKFRRVAGKKVAAASAGAARVLVWTPELQEMLDRHRLVKKNDARMVLLLRD